MHIEVIKCAAEAKAAYRCANCRADVIAGAIFIIIGAAFIFIEAVNNAGFQSGASQKSHAFGCRDEERNHVSLCGFGFTIFTKSACIDARPFGVGYACGNREGFAEAIGRQDTSMSLRFDRMPKRTGVVRVGRAFDGFITDDAVEYANLSIQAVAYGHSQCEVGLANGKIGGNSTFCTGPETLSPEGIGIRASP